MKSHPQFIFSTILLWSILFVNQAHAELCSEKMRSEVRTDQFVCAVMPVIGWVSGLCDIPNYNKKELDASVLDAATTILHQSSSDKKNSNANLIIDKFYDQLEMKYPKMQLGRDEVIELLNDINLNGVENGQCPLGLYRGSRIANVFFPEAKAQSYFEIAKKMSQAHEEVIEAKRVRDEKNSAAENLNYHDLSEDEVVKKFLVK